MLTLTLILTLTLTLTLTDWSFKIHIYQEIIEQNALSAEALAILIKIIPTNVRYRAGSVQTLSLSLSLTLFILSAAYACSTPVVPRLGYYIVPMGTI
jgi:hypothetical protein